MILKLETYVEVNTSDPTVVKQVLTERLNSALTELINHQSPNCLLMKVEKVDAGNNPHLKYELSRTEQFIATLTGGNLKGSLLTPDQVLERMRKGQ